MLLLLLLVFAAFLLVRYEAMGALCGEVTSASVTICFWAIFGFRETLCAVELCSVVVAGSVARALEYCFTCLALLRTGA